MRYAHYFQWHPSMGEPRVCNFADIAGLPSDMAPQFDANGTISEAAALKLVNLWNTGSHHNYRYWI
jgi:hypothetical protein